MNERIYELALQAQMTANNGNHVDVKIMMAKFGVLIIRECSLVADRAQAEDMGWNIGEIIKEHFGVE